MKRCEVCDKEIPDSFTNALCYEHYDAQVAEASRIHTQETDSPTSQEAIIQSQPDEDGLVPTTEFSNIHNAQYRERPEQEDKPQWEANVVQFAHSGYFLWKATKWMYNYIKDYAHERGLRHPQAPAQGGKHIWLPKIVDVGCGSGAGSNLLSQSADFVWGIDKNEASVKFAKELFTREKNNVYYTPQVTFDQIDIIRDEHKYTTFDIVVAIEVIEHIYDYQTFLAKLVAFAKKDKKDRFLTGSHATDFFISSPNRNHKSIGDDYPKNKYHVREWSSEEFAEVLQKYFKEVKFMTAKGEPIEGYSTQHTPILAHCTDPY